MATPSLAYGLSHLAPSSRPMPSSAQTPSSMQAASASASPQPPPSPSSSPSSSQARRASHPTSPQTPSTPSTYTQTPSTYTPSSLTSLDPEKGLQDTDLQNIALHPQPEPANSDNCTRKDYIGMLIFGLAFVVLVAVAIIVLMLEGD
ncbi:hypothetical protein BDV97DRAFT_423221 [Delphinella strobiligena]|nr:hypothetical protein BDV97DRAFT_423221 [Delphinella strobiligena]